ncbi:MAG TPA: polyprenyl synthetase family protein [Mycobacteriales bacterium]|nr:polyprenyl synthetase family protein [Mycobacteriales bacterium]
MVPAVLTGLAFDDPALEASVRADLQRVEARLRDASVSNYGFLDETAHHLSEAGGKRFRSLVTLLAAHAAVDLQAGAAPEPVLGAAVAIELTHLSTLYHDDVMDEATMRRGAQSVNARWDNTIAILTGDFLFAHASRLVSELGTDAARIIAETFGELVTGQMRETVGPDDGEDPVDHYLSVIAQKTGSLIATCGRFGGMVSEAEPEHVAALCRFGDIIGTAFQISDDIIDIASPSDESGKTPGTDLREGVRTLPMLYALADPGTDPRLTELLAGPIAEDKLVDEALELLRASSGLDRAMATLSDYALRARAELSALPASSARDACESVADYLVARTR